ncbi:MAG: endonuclease III [Chloroflexota bacterium]
MAVVSESIRGRALQVVERLAAAYPDAKCSLDYAGPFQLLIATILAAQCTDERVNQVTPALFARFPTPAAFAEAPLPDIEEAIRSTGFFRNKARHIQGASRMIVEEFGGETPCAMADLLRLPGVARKTANVVMGNGYGRVEGVIVDTHVGRISRRLGLTTAEDPVRVEHDLMALLPQSEWLAFNHRVIDFGRAICKAPRPRCAICMLADLCPSYDPTNL